MEFLYILPVLFSLVTKGTTQTDTLEAGQLDGDITYPTPPPPFAETSPEFYPDYTNYVSLGSDYCLSKEKCESDSSEYQLFPTKNCYCDSLCTITNDCCPNYKPQEKDIPNFTRPVFECAYFPDAVQYPGYGVTMVTKCDTSWPDGDIKDNCENYASRNDTVLTVPVSEPVHNILFRNMYCSICNYNYDYQFWKMIVKCDLGSPGDCFSEFQHPQPTKRNRMCPLGGLIDSCSENQESNDNYAEKCLTSGYSLAYYYRSMYRNKFCALCDGVPVFELLCEPDLSTAPTSSNRTIDPRYGYTFRMLVDFNSGFFTDINGAAIRPTRRCRDTEIYDPTAELCREILCPEPLVAKDGKCKYDNSTSVNTRLSQKFGSKNCTLSKLEPSEYEFINTSYILLLSSNTVYGEEMFEVSGSDLFMCLDIDQSCIGECGHTGAMFTFDETETYLSFISIIISLVALAMTFIVYIYFSDLQNTPGKILICLIVSLFIAQLMFILSPSAQNNTGACQTIAILMHYFFLAAFCWMNIVALDLWMTFSRQFITPGSGSKSVKRFLKFSLYGWGLPIVVVSVAVMVEFIDLDEDFINLKPRYGRNVCWITSRDALLLFFAGPLALFKLFDIVAFIFTSIHIIRAKRQGAMARQKKNMCSFLINIKLSLVMGLTWVFAFLANIANIPALWYMFSVFNCLQGLFIAISFLCTTKVRRLVRSKYEEVSKSRSSTQMTSLNPSSENKHRPI